MWEAICDTVKGATKERVGEKKHQRNKPWFAEECLKLHEERKQARQELLSNKSEANANHYSNGNETNATRVFRNKKREYLMQKIQEIEENVKTNNIRSLILSDFLFHAWPFLLVTYAPKFLNLFTFSMTSSLILVILFPSFPVFRLVIMYFVFSMFTCRPIS